MATKPGKRETARVSLPRLQMQRLKEAVKKKYPEGGTASQFMRWAIVKGIDEVLGEGK